MDTMLWLGYCLGVLTCIVLLRIDTALRRRRRGGSRVISDMPPAPVNPPNPASPRPPWRAPREGGYRGRGGTIPASPPRGTSATSRGRTPPPPRGGSGQATGR